MWPFNLLKKKKKMENPNQQQAGETAEVKETAPAKPTATRHFITPPDNMGFQHCTKCGHIIFDNPEKAWGENEAIIDEHGEVVKELEKYDVTDCGAGQEEEANQ